MVASWISWKIDSLQFLTVKIVIPERIQNEIYKLIQMKYFKNKYNSEYESILSAALNDAYTKKCNIIQNACVNYLGIVIVHLFV